MAVKISWTRAPLRPILILKSLTVFFVVVELTWPLCVVQRDHLNGCSFLPACWLQWTTAGARPEVTMRFCRFAFCVDPSDLHSVALRWTGNGGETVCPVTVFRGVPSLLLCCIVMVFPAPGILLQNRRMRSKESGVFVLSCVHSSVGMVMSSAAGEVKSVVRGQWR